MAKLSNLPVLKSPNLWNGYTTIYPEGLVDVLEMMHVVTQ